MRDKVHPLELERTAGINTELVDVEVPTVDGDRETDFAAGFPRGALIVLIGRDNKFIVPNGGTVLESGDRLLVLADKDNLGKTDGSGL